ncbi:MAG: hypothetical protein CMJ30_06230 [Phycisphaerae bacterium]|nr:hypothetical protein [Phycisphaerae bacterium]
MHASPEPTHVTNPSDQVSAAVILAAGKGTRMGSDLPKVMHEVAGKSMLDWVVDAAEAAGVQRIVLVVGYGQELVRDAMSTRDNVAFAEQVEQLGTGHATLCAESAVGDADDVLVLAGDGPLIRASVLRQLIASHRQSSAAASLATARIDDPTGYGRIVRDSDGQFSEIVEQKNGSADQLQICEVNPSYYCFGRHVLFEALHGLRPDATGGEYYLTDVPGILKGQGHHVELLDEVPQEDVLSINTIEQLSRVDDILRSRLSSNATGAPS